MSHFVVHLVSQENNRPSNPICTIAHKRRRLCTIRRKVRGLIPDGFIAIFHLLNLYGNTMVLGSNQITTEKSNRGLCLGVKAAGM